jgi:fermentation-respiration switch protein FrsA (DUF1100 family)
MSGTPLRSPVVLLALVACACSATTRGIGTVPAPARQPSVTTDVVYGHKDGLALTLDVHRPAHPNGAGLISIVSGGWQSSVELAQIFTQQPVFKFTEAEASQFSPIRFVSSGSAPSLIVHGDADTVVPIDQGETMYAALTRAGVPASFIRMERAGHGFEGAAAADLERAYAALMQWFEQHLGSAAK